LRHIGHGLVQQLQGRARIGQEALPLLRDGEPPHLAIEEPHTELLLQFGHALAHRGRRQVQPQGGRPEAAARGSLDEGEQALQVFSTGNHKAIYFVSLPVKSGSFCSDLIQWPHQQPGIA